MVNLSAQAFNTVLDLTSTTATSFATAMGTADVTVGSSAAILEAVYYDAVNSQAVVGYVASNSGGSSTHINSADAGGFTEIVRIGMTAADYNHLDATNLHFF